MLGVTQVMCKAMGSVVVGGGGIRINAYSRYKGAQGGGSNFQKNVLRNN